MDSRRFSGYCLNRYTHYLKGDRSLGAIECLNINKSLVK
ncbi:hypothetical protein THERMOS_2102 [Bathymodiolus thermophilus thioautotrophic gill symbiont]|uniref:Uncharacterized protein n=1 Tax=Bathymodiolus thermophilus thioautotrophic gill symbiont TaxID=2360 RepID=A0A8H8XER3_9GAMM|nr:hypothetical protein THERMOS_2102 [Bathymodiolus thermophilus thioautotrophic gill symbiont]